MTYDDRKIMEKAESYANSAVGDAIYDVLNDEDSNCTLEEILLEHLSKAFMAGYKLKEEEEKK